MLIGSVSYCRPHGKSKERHAQSRSLTLTSLLYALLRLVEVLWCMCLGELLHLSTHLRHEPLSDQGTNQLSQPLPSSGQVHRQQTANCILQVHSRIFVHTHLGLPTVQSIAYLPSSSHHVRLASRSAEGFDAAIRQTVQHAHRRKSR
jgi:hypothetical protein